MAQFDFYLNRSGVRGPQGIQGEQGFSPIITVATNTLSEYVLQIQTQNNTFLTANLREHKDDLGGTYIRYNRETGVMYAGDADVASESQMGVVRFATATDIEREDDSSVVSPANVADMIAAIDPSGDITNLQDRVTTLEGETDSLEGSVSANSLAISELQSNVSGLLANYVPKARTINGYALSSNITLAASDVNAYSKTETDVLLADKADVSDLPDMNNYYNTTQIDLMLNDKADISDIPTVGNGTITFTQGGVTKGTITTNQSGDTTIALDAGGGSQYILPPATTSTLGGVIVDGTTITVDSNGVITSVGGGGGGTTYNPGNGIDINSSTNTISAKPDGTTIDFNTNGELKVISAPTPSNMVTTDTTQTISGTKSFSNGVKATFVDDLDGGVIVSSLSGTMQVGNGTLNSLGLYTGGNSITVNRAGSNYVNIDSGNIGSYALTSLPTASTSTLGGVKVDGTTITIDNNGVISSSGGGGSSYTAGTGIDIDNDVISIDDTVVATKDDLDSKQDSFESVAPLNLTQAVNVGKAYLVNTETEFAGDVVTETISLLKSGDQNTGFIPGFDATLPWKIAIKNVKLTSIPTSTPGVVIGSRFDNGSSQILIKSDGNFYYNCNYGSYIDAVLLTPQLNHEYDFEISYDGTGIITFKGKESSSDTYMSFTYSYTFSSTPKYNFLNVGTSYTTFNIGNVSFTNNNNILFENRDSQLSLSISTGLAVVNGALTATATPVTVDQTYDATSANAQSGTAVAGAIANKVTGTGITNMVALTQAQYDALATKDANTFYVIVAASL